MGYCDDLCVSRGSDGKVGYDRVGLGQAGGITAAVIHLGCMLYLLGAVLLQCSSIGLVGYKYV